jgi:hypothetical protein
MGAVTFSSPDTNIAPGDPVVLNWSGPAGATYQIQYYTQEDGFVTVPALNADALANQGQYPDQGTNLILQRNTTFTLNVSETVNGISYTAQNQVQVTVDTPPVLGITSFAASATDFGAGETYTLSWVVTDAVTCELAIENTTGSVLVPCLPNVTNSVSVISTDGRTLQITNAAGTVLGSLPIPNGVDITIVLIASNSVSVEGYLVIGLLPANINSFSAHENPEVPMWTDVEWSVSNSYQTTLNGKIVANSGNIGHKIGYFTLTAQGFGAEAGSTI